MSSDLNVLLEMGFPENRAKRALSATQYKGLQVAMDWMISHENDPNIDDPFQEPEGHKLGDGSSSNAGDAGSNQTRNDGTPATNGSSGEKPKSLKCDDCGKLIKTPADVEVHAARTGHQNYSESVEEVKPLTEEQKKEQLARLQEKMKLKQQEKEAQEKKEALEREKLRRKQGKELTSLKQQKELDEMKRIAEMKKREKMEDRLARLVVYRIKTNQAWTIQRLTAATHFCTALSCEREIGMKAAVYLRSLVRRGVGKRKCSAFHASSSPIEKVKAEIARDKAERAARFAKTSTGNSPSSPGGKSPLTQQSAVKKDYDEARIQIRLTDGSALTHTFSANEQLAAVKLYVETNHKDGSGAPFTLMTTFPKKVFTPEDMETPLKALGLIPSAVLVMKPL